MNEISTNGDLSIIDEPAEAITVKKYAIDYSVGINKIGGVLFQFRKAKGGAILFTYTSPSIEEIVGLAPAELLYIPQKIAKVFHIKDVRNITHDLDNSEKHIKPWIFEYRIWNGQIEDYIWIRGEAIPSLDLDSLVIWNGSLVNVTKEKALERHLQQCEEELKKTNQELDRFVYSTSHDLRAPLASVLGLINIMKQEFNNEMLLNYLGMAEMSVFKLEKIIRSILEYSRNNRTDLQIEEIDFKKITTEILENYKYLIPENFKNSIEINQSQVFFSDARRIRIILENIISNTFKYLDKEKETSYMHVVIDSYPEGVIIMISDNGIGIQEEHMNKVFDMFVRATEKSDGAGLGLYVVKESVRKLGGVISVESKSKSGTSFTIKIPNRQIASGFTV